MQKKTFKIQIDLQGDFFIKKILNRYIHKNRQKRYTFKSNLTRHN